MIERLTRRRIIIAILGAAWTVFIVTVIRPLQYVRRLPNGGYGFGKYGVIGFGETSDDD